MSGYSIDIITSEVGGVPGPTAHAGIEVRDPSGNVVASIHGGPVSGIGSADRAGVNSLYRDDVPLTVNLGGGTFSEGSQGFSADNRATIVDGLSRTQALDLLEAGGSAALSTFGTNTEYQAAYIDGGIPGLGDLPFRDSFAAARAGYPMEAVYQNSNSVAWIVGNQIVVLAQGLGIGTNLNPNAFNELGVPLPGLLGGVIGTIQRIDQCFLHDSKVQMWPLDPSIKPRVDGSYDDELVLSKVWYKQQDEIAVGDVVVSYDKQGRLQPGDVTRTMTNIATHILDFWGTGVTPGHVYSCADGPLKGSFAPIMDILRMDGALMRSNGTMFRAATNCDVGSIGDRMIHAEASAQNSDGSWTPKQRGQIRFGTRISTPDGKKSVSVMDIAERRGWSLSDDGYMVGKIDGQEAKFPFPYTFGSELPKTEDYILTRSQVTLEEIYLANEWEQIGTRLPAPESLADFNHHSTTKRAKPKPNIPPAFANRPDAPTAQTQRPARASASLSAPSMNRKQRKAMEAKQRKATKARRDLTIARG